MDVEIAVHPIDFAAGGLLDDAERAACGIGGGLVDDAEGHGVRPPAAPGTGARRRQHEEAVGIVAVGQGNQASRDAPLPKTFGETLSCLLAAAVGVGIKGEIDGSGCVAELPELARIEMGSQRAGDVVETGLPQHGVVEQALDEDHFRIGLGVRPRVQAALGAGQKSMRRGRRRKAAAIEIALQRKDDPMHVCVVAGGGHQSGLTQSRQRVAQLRQPTSQATARRVTDAHVLDQFQGADSALVQIGHCLAVTV